MLSKIARHFGQEEAVALLRDAQVREEAGDMDDAIRLYRRAFRSWPELDSVQKDGLPVAVRAAAKAAGIDCGEAPMEAAPAPRFPVAETEQWLAYLEEHGYCVLAGVADAEEVARARALLWDFLESVPDTKVRHDDASTWVVEAGWLPSPSNGLLNKVGFGHSAFCWQTRLLPKVKQSFAAIWGTGDLIVSFDGGNVFRPWAQKPEWRTEGSWWHIDQNAFLPGRDRRVSVQGLVTYTDATPETGGLCVVPGSHKQHREVCERMHSQKLPGDFVPVLEEDPVLEEGGRLVCARAGDLLLWDSRCVHCNTPGFGPQPATPSDEGSPGAPPASAEELEVLRAVGYVCMTPAAWASNEVLAARRNAFVGNAGTGHLPHELQGVEPAPPWLPPNSWSCADDAKRQLVGGALASE